MLPVWVVSNEDMPWPTWILAYPEVFVGAHLATRDELQHANNSTTHKKNTGTQNFKKIKLMHEVGGGGG
jgi:hypothetical protein